MKEKGLWSRFVYEIRMFSLFFTLFAGRRRAPYLVLVATWRKAWI